MTPTIVLLALHLMENLVNAQLHCSHLAIRHCILANVWIIVQNELVLIAKQLLR